MAVERNKIVGFCGQYLKAKDFEDHCINGLQVEGSEKVERIVVGVSLSQRLIESAIRKKAEMIIVHHGLSSKNLGNPPGIKGYTKERLKLLLENNMSLCGFHLPLDAHPLIGNGVSLAKLFSLNSIKPFYFGVIGNLAREIEFEKFVKTVDEKLKVKSYHIFAGKRFIKRIGIVSGAAAAEFYIAAELGADVYLCGDIKESIVRAVEETGINFINAGHYNTEKLGIENLGKLIAKKFKVSVEFVDVPNEI